MRQLSAPPTRPIGLQFILFVSLLAGACSGQRDTRPAEPVRTARTVSRTRHPSLPVDLGAVIRRARLAFIPDPDGSFRGSHGTYASRVDRQGQLTVTPAHFPRGVRHPIHGTPLRLRTISLCRGASCLRHQPSEAPLRGQDGSVAIARGSGVTEQIENRRQGVEQRWHFARQPDGSGDLLVRVALDGAPWVATTGAGFHFAAPGGPGVRHGRATWIDADGRRSAISTRLVAGDLVHRVPHALLARSRFPAQLDPTISAEIGTGQPATGPAWDEQLVADAATDGVDYLVVWKDFRNEVDFDIYGARLTAGGVLVGDTSFVICGASGDQERPQVAFDGTNYLVVWEDSRTGDYDIHGARVTPGGVVLDPGGFQICGAPDLQFAPSPAFDGTNFLVVWADRRSGVEYDIHGARVTPSGVVLDPTGVLLSGATGRQGEPTLAFDGTTYLVVWFDERDGVGDSNIYGTRVDKTGAALDPAGIPICTASGGQRHPDLAFNGTDYLVLWLDERTSVASDIYASRVSIAGTVLDTAGIAVCTEADVQQRPGVVQDQTGFLTVWQDRRNGTDSDIYGARLDGNGAVLDAGGVALVAANETQERPVVIKGQTDFLVTWHDTRSGGSDIYGARITSDPIAGIGLLDGQGFVVSRGFNGQLTPAIASDGAGFLVVWQDRRNGLDLDIFGTRVDSTNGVLDPAGIPISTATGDQAQPRLAFDGTRYLVVWQDERNGTADIYGARVDLAGTVLDSTGIAISSATDQQQQPDVDGNSSGFLVAWQDHRSTTGWDVYGARVDGAGNVLDASGTSISAVALDQTRPAVAASSSGFLVAWQDRRNATWDVYASRLDSAGVVLDAGGLVIAGSSTDLTRPALTFGGTNFYAAWLAQSATGFTIIGSRIAPTGQILNPPGIEITDDAPQEASPVVASDGLGFLAAWVQQATIGHSLHARRIRKDGVVVEPVAFDIASELLVLDEQRDVAVAGLSGQGYMVTYTRLPAPTATTPLPAVVLRRITWSPDGQTCTGVADCTSGYCADGVCCNEPCGSGQTEDCQACSTGAGAAVSGVCGPVSSGTTCRAKFGVCDQEELCDGVALSCPPDTFKPDTVVCRPAVGECDVVEMCSGSDPGCGPDFFAPDTQPCTGASNHCIGGMCVPIPDLGPADLSPPDASPDQSIPDLPVPDLGQDQTLPDLPAPDTTPDVAGPDLGADLSPSDLQRVDHPRPDSELRPPSDVGGCLCQAHGAASLGDAWIWCMLGLGLLVSRRRRRPVV